VSAYGRSFQQYKVGHIFPGGTTPSYLFKVVGGLFPADPIQPQMALPIFGWRVLPQKLGKQPAKLVDEMPQRG